MTLELGNTPIGRPAFSPSSLRLLVTSPFGMAEWPRLSLWLSVVHSGRVSGTAQTQPGAGPRALDSISASGLRHWQLQPVPAAGRTQTLAPTIQPSRSAADRSARTS